MGCDRCICARRRLGLALLVLFFVVGVMRTRRNFAEVKMPRTGIEAVYPFCPCEGAVTYGWSQIMALLILQRLDFYHNERRRFWFATDTVLPQEIVIQSRTVAFSRVFPFGQATS